MTTTPSPEPRHPMACTDCGAPATIEALHVNHTGELLSDVAACDQHADPYLQTATDVVYLDHTDNSPPATALPKSASGPVPALGDQVTVDGQTWQVWDVCTGPDSGHKVALYAENPNDDTRGSLATVTWTETTDTHPPEVHPSINLDTQGETARAGLAHGSHPVIDTTSRAGRVAAHTKVPTEVEQELTDPARAEAVEYQDDLELDDSPNLANGPDLADDLGL